MNESDMPREWWQDQDQDEAWIKQQEEEMQQREAQRVPVQLELPFDAPTEQELEEEYDAFMARLEEEAKRHES
jgi:2-succinyl-5-enolpyruvyl-6-hydroxy-3-cyclohexene-1-carboxylate synthase